MSEENKVEKLEIINECEVHFNESDDEAKSYVSHMKERISKTEIMAIIKAAKNSSSTRIDLEDRYGHRVTLEFRSEKSCLIRKRG
ncbi:MAG TPA: hypothetical protein PLO44_00050 [Candidatus Paceibacterota bacterium]|nr:hypothetical protein [Candidatus Paceibacterota bacterium]